jgi:hypothetical protein
VVVTKQGQPALRGPPLGAGRSTARGATWEDYIINLAPRLGPRAEMPLSPPTVITLRPLPRSLQKAPSFPFSFQLGLSLSHS